MRIRDLAKFGPRQLAKLLNDRIRTADLLVGEKPMEMVIRPVSLRVVCLLTVTGILFVACGNLQ